MIGIMLILLAGTLLCGYNVSETIKTDAAKILFVFVIFLAAKAFNMINIIGILRSGGDTRFTLFFDSAGIWLIAVKNIVAQENLGL